MDADKGTVGCTREATIQVTESGCKKWVKTDDKGGSKAYEAKDVDEECSVEEGKLTLGANTSVGKDGDLWIFEMQADNNPLKKYESFETAKKLVDEGARAVDAGFGTSSDQ